MLAVQLMLNALTLGAAYALVALGFVLILNATGAVNFSHGDLIMVGGFAAVVLASHLSAPGLVLLPLLIVAMAALGVIIAVVAYFPLRRRPPEAVFISTIAVGIILQNAATVLFGPEPRAAPSLLGPGVRMGRVDPQSLAIIAVAGALIGALYVVLMRTQFGRQLRATAQDAEMAATLGIRVDRTIAGAFAVGAALAGTAGLLLSNKFFVTPTEGTTYILKAYVATVIGGWGSIPGAAVGGLLIAAFEVLFPSLPLAVPGIGDSAVFTQSGAAIALDAVILGILFFRPQGLFGERVRTRV